MGLLSILLIYWYYIVAGEKAIKSSSFSSAAKYFEAALSLHGEDGDYDFLMKVYGLLQLPLFAIGDFTRLETIIDKTLSLSRTFEEKRPSYLCLVKVLSAKGQLQGKRVDNLSPQSLFFDLLVSHINLQLQKR